MKRIGTMGILFCMVWALFGCGMAKPAETTKADQAAEASATAQETDEKSQVSSNYPTMAVVINTAKAGLNVDYAARALASLSNEYLGESMVVSNLTGQVEAVRDTMNAEADGYTICLVNSSVLINDVTGGTDYDSVEDVKIISSICTNIGNWICVKKNFADENGIEDLAGLFAYTKEHPDELIVSDKVATNTNTVVSQLRDLGMEATSADTGSASDKVTNFLSGACDIYVGPYSNIEQYIQTGEVVCLASCSQERSRFTPDLPCTYELGYEAACPSVYYICAPKNIPEAAVQTLEEFIEEACNNQSFIETLESFTAEIEYKNSADAYEYLKEQKEEMIDLGMGTGYQG